jgi:hypothetical protein
MFLPERAILGAETALYSDFGWCIGSKSPASARMLAAAPQ